MPVPTLLIKGSLKYPAIENNDEVVPIEYIIGQIKDRLGKTGIENRLFVLKSETASGKSTTIPAETYINLVHPLSMGGRAPGIICTQPKTITAIRNVAEIIHNAGPSYPQYLKLGETIGWSTKHNKLRTVRGGLLSATIGTLTMQLKSMTDEQIMDTYRFIMIDETHERDLQIDMTLYMLKKFLVRNGANPKCPMVMLMSATFDPNPFLKYFGGTMENNYIYVGGASQGHKEMWDWNQGRTIQNYMKSAADVVDLICRGEGAKDNTEEADILIFMPGLAEFKECQKYLIAVNDKLAKDGLPIFSLLLIDAEAMHKESRDYKGLDLPTPLHIVRGHEETVPLRRVIISTNMAETGLTLLNLKYVVDSGYNREIEFNPNYCIRALVTKPSPESRRIQRRGRAGRKFPGIFYPLYPKYIQEKLPKQQLPQILTEDVSPIMLDIISVASEIEIKTTAYAINEAEEDEEDKVFDLTKIDMIDVPTPDSLGIGLEKLAALGFIEIARGGHKITSIGRLATRFNQISPESIRMILSSWYWGCDPRDLITIAAYLMTQNSKFKISPKQTIDWKQIYKEGIKGVLFGTPFFGGEDAPHTLYRTQMVIADAFIEGIILLNALVNVNSPTKKGGPHKSPREWAEEVGLSYDTLMSFIRTRDDIINQCITAGLDVFKVASKDPPMSLMTASGDSFADYVARLKYCIYDGYRLNMLIMGEDGKYRSRSGGIIVECPGLWDDTLINKEGRIKEGVSVSSRPKVLLYSELSLKYSRATKIYDVVCDRTCALDGYVAFDPSFCS
jgi:HrpA-like RNA helicase